MILVFWVCTILLVLAGLGAWYGVRYGQPAAILLIAIDLIILGLRVLGAPR
jgi:hypothetical protein